MAQRNNDGVNYLMALRQNTDPVATEAVSALDANAMAATAGVPSGGFQGAEKRRSPRYKCEGSAEICEVGCSVKTWATFSDISLHGCYVEAQATYPVGTVLQLKLEVHGHTVVTPGTVRVNYPYLGMGIAFVEMTDENRAHLRELLASISRPAVIMGPGIASTLPARGPLEPLPAVSDPRAAIQALTEFFSNRQMLMRDDFVRVLRLSQKQSS
jgi:hypothetical protein